MTTIGLSIISLIVCIVAFGAIGNVFGAVGVAGGVVALLLAREIWLAGREA